MATSSWPITTPLTPRITPNLIPARISGKALKKRILVYSCRRVAPKQRAISTNDRSACCKPTRVSRMITKTAKRNTVTTTVDSPMPISAIRTGTSAEIGALMKILTHRPRILPTLATLAINKPMGMPTSSASAMPSAKERNEIATAAPNFAVGIMVIPAVITPENGGTMVDSLARPTISQITNQITSEKRIGMRLPNKIISDHKALKALPSAVTHTASGSAICHLRYLNSSCPGGSRRGFGLLDEYRNE